MRGWDAFPSSPYVMGCVPLLPVCDGMRFPPPRMWWDAFPSSPYVGAVATHVAYRRPVLLSARCTLRWRFYSQRWAWWRRPRCRSCEPSTCSRSGSVLRSPRYAGSLKQPHATEAWNGGTERWNGTVAWDGSMERQHGTAAQNGGMERLNGTVALWRHGTVAYNHRLKRLL